VSADTAIEYPRFKWLVASKIAGAPHPDLFGGLTVVASFLREQGIGGIVTLCERPLEQNVESLGFKYLFAETPDFRPPSDLPRILAFVEMQVEQGRGVLVHCFAGIGRTGTVLAAWLLRQEDTLSVRGVRHRTYFPYRYAACTESQLIMGVSLQSPCLFSFVIGLL
jgi:protein-tyrosine phosphatase